MKSLMDVAVRRVQRTDAMFVQESNRTYALRVLVLDAALFVIAVTAWVVLAELHGWWRGVAAVIIGLQLGRAGIVSYRRAAAYRSGWLRGRSQFVMSMAEAQRRGLPAGDWLLLEASRDYAVLGLTPEDLHQLRPDTPTEE
jgi:hypothetical protein